MREEGLSLGETMATFYYHLKRMENLDKYQEVKEEIKTIYHENKGRYGYRRITAELHNRGFHLNHKTIQRLMKQLGLICRVRAKKYRSYKGEVGKIAPNLLQRDFYAEKPNQKWGNRCYRIQSVRAKTVSVRPSGFTQQLSDQLYHFRTSCFKDGNQYVG
ncbi:HTH-like domain-containing protein [[Clostridium] lactatifermentans DSM 14214]|uniref:HTH-like domain-containing protein n=1 Tax=Anaerotignum lactatifermentans DSM 14214 TaxID=1121323 RepID=A0A1M6L7D2_9FIRM|nr:HTH-like domain-containing protein [[Clostridium] lactatifermentans DSM 14214] [Anaerotignum lactatifermentans DSM 14214]